MKWIINPLTQFLKNYWFITYNVLTHTAIPYSKNQVIEFIFDISKVGDLSPWLLGSIFSTIIQNPHIDKCVGNVNIIITAYYEGDTKSLAKSYCLTKDSTPEDFINHFLHFTNKVGHGESTVVLANAQFLKVKAVVL